MHRKRTKFAARVHRVASALERRGIVATYELHDRLLANRTSRRRYTHEPPALDETQQGIVDRLREEGYATLPLSELISAEEWQEVEADGSRFVAEAERGLEEESGRCESVPRSAAGGERDSLWPWRPLGENYPPQDEFAERIDGRAVSFTAPKGTIIFCNTCGFHRGGFATAKPRVLATFTWDSPASLKALSERNYLLEQTNGAAL